MFFILLIRGKYLPHGVIYSIIVLTVPGRFSEWVMLS